MIEAEHLSIYFTVNYLVIYFISLLAYYFFFLI